MPAIVRPSREFKFADHARINPRNPVPADRLDAQIQNLIDAIHSTQQALTEIRRDDGKLRNQSVGPEQLTPGITETITEQIRDHTEVMATRAEQGAAKARHTENNVALFAKDAEAAAFSAAQFLSAVNAAKKAVDESNDHVTAKSNETDFYATDAENWANYSEAQADNAMKAKDEALQWAEYLAGPVVNLYDAPAYIANSPFPHGLYYQPVEGYGGMGGLWSAKWWAIYAAQLVGPWGYYYLGGWDQPPIPGSVNPDTGVKVPNPLAPGSFYYDITTGQLYVWNGSQWTSPTSLAAGVNSKYVYVATAGQTTYSGADSNGATPAVKNSPSDVHLNGVRLIEVTDYSVNAGTSTLTLLNLTPPAGSVIQWDLLVPPSSLTPGSVQAFKTTLAPATPDGSNKVFTLTYNNPSTGIQPVDVTSGAQLQVSLDGIVQEPGVDYVASGNTVTMAVAPVTASHFWIVWFANTVLT